MKKLLVCTNRRTSPQQPSCGARGSDALLNALLREASGIAIEASPCMGYCTIGPNVRLSPNGPCLHGVSTETLQPTLAAIAAFMADS